MGFGMRLWNEVRGFFVWKRIPRSCSSKESPSELFALTASLHRVARVKNSWGIDPEPSETPPSGTCGSDGKAETQCRRMHAPLESIRFL